MHVAPCARRIVRIAGALIVKREARTDGQRSATNARELDAQRARPSAGSLVSAPYRVRAESSLERAANGTERDGGHTTVGERIEGLDIKAGWVHLPQLPRWPLPTPTSDG
ncbi:MAG: hypothetical protein HRT86_06970 [Ilumatobacteraceae bacterium]|nr:hypothetical protein [Ilumatobacteraceae bacterium]